MLQCGTKRFTNYSKWRDDELSKKALSVGRVVNIQVNLGPVAAKRADFGVLNILGTSGIITKDERFRVYTSIEGVAGDFGADTPEYEAAVNYFAQIPSPRQLMISSWYPTATAAILRGGVLTSSEQAMGVWTPVTNGEFSVAVNGVVKTFKGLDFSLETNLNGVASKINDKTSPEGATIEWSGERFIIRTNSAGGDQKIGYVTLVDPATPGATDISSMMKLTNVLALPPVDGSDSESLTDAVVLMADISGDWYGLMVATDKDIEDDEHIKVARFIEASERPRQYGVTVTDTRVLDVGFNQDFSSKVKAMKLNRTITQYSSKNKYAVASIFGREFTVNFNGSMTTITLKFKQEPGITYEQLSETQAKALKDKNCNVFALYNNDTSILQEGVMASGAFIDEIHNLDWLANALQTEIYNTLYTSPTKIPQTEEGVAILVAIAKGVCEEGVRNGMIGRKLRWNTNGFGTLNQGDILTAGYYIYTVPLSEQPQSERERRIAPVLQIAVKLAGAIHFVDGVINVNR